MRPIVEKKGKSHTKYDRHFKPKEFSSALPFIKITLYYQHNKFKNSNIWDGSKNTPLGNFCEHLLGSTEYKKLKENLEGTGNKFPNSTISTPKSFKVNASESVDLHFQFTERDNSALLSLERMGALRLRDAYNIDNASKSYLAKESWAEWVTKYIYEEKSDDLYKKAKDDLADATGLYCAYCEQPILDPQVGDIEHILPKSEFPDFMLEWDNFLIACKPCNESFKKARPSKNFLLEKQATIDKAKAPFEATMSLPLYDEKLKKLLDSKLPAYKDSSTKQKFTYGAGELSITEAMTTNERDELLLLNALDLYKTQVTDLEKNKNIGKVDFRLVSNDVNNLVKGSSVSYDFSKEELTTTGKLSLPDLVLLLEFVQKHGPEQQTDKIKWAFNLLRLCMVSHCIPAFYELVPINPETKDFARLFSVADNDNNFKNMLTCLVNITGRQWKDTTTAYGYVRWINAVIQSVNQLEFVDITYTITDSATTTVPLDFKAIALKNKSGLTYQPLGAYTLAKKLENQGRTMVFWPDWPWKTNSNTAYETAAYELFVFDTNKTTAWKDTDTHIQKILAEDAKSISDMIGVVAKDSVIKKTVQVTKLRSNSSEEQSFVKASLFGTTGTTSEEKETQVHITVQRNNTALDETLVEHIDMMGLNQTTKKGTDHRVLNRTNAFFIALAEAKRLQLLEQRRSKIDDLSGYLEDSKNYSNPYDPQNEENQHKLWNTNHNEIKRIVKSSSDSIAEQFAWENIFKMCETIGFFSVWRTVFNQFKHDVQYDLQVAGNKIESKTLKNKAEMLMKALHARAKANSKDSHKYHGSAEADLLINLKKH